MITANDHSLRLYNGDLGIVRRGTDGPEVVFPASGDGVRSLPAGRLPPHEAAFAITIHKSQGSEFGRVLLILPPAHRVDADGTSPVGMPTRELVYTAITRARHGVEIWGETGVLARAVAAQVRRASALAARLG
jgi:exodeoxyribonuclease V alpha subunit